MMVIMMNNETKKEKKENFLICETLMAKHCTYFGIGFPILVRYIFPLTTKIQVKQENKKKLCFNIYVEKCVKNIEFIGIFQHTKNKNQTLFTIRMMMMMMVMKSSEHD